jgi:two-component system, NarL family, invasion response regulator UvrY
MHRILIADDHPIIQNGLKYVLQDQLKNVSIDSAYNGQQVFALLKNQVFDLLILDINMPNMSFSDFELVRDQYPNQKILIFTQHLDDQYAIRYLKKGATGFLNKSVTDKELMAVIYRILDGHKYYSPSVIDQIVVQAKGKTTENPIEKLSSREYDIVQYITKGVSLNEIGQQLHISMSATSTYKNRAMQKLGVKNLVELIELANQYLK